MTYILSDKIYDFVRISRECISFAQEFWELIMIKGKKLVAILPAYNAEKTLKQTYDEIPFDIVDE